MATKILGISASLRNARRNKGNNLLVEDLIDIKSKSELIAYLKEHASIHLNHFVELGRKENKPFDELYKKVRSLKGIKGLSNSEVALASALWAARQIGADIECVSLSEYFSEHGAGTHIDELKNKLLEADGIILSTPVYFGDRGSLSQSLFTMIKNDPELLKKLKQKVYAGLAVGAKRNGGQETTLMYQLWDMLTCGLLGVGNDSETTSQYGGTGLAGDIGTMPEDNYGIDTCMGTGRRIARVVGMLQAGKERTLNRKPKVAFWVLQDNNAQALEYTKNLAAKFSDKIETKIMNIAGNEIFRCLACDICPTHVDIDDEYRCIIKNKNDDISELHPDLIEADAIVPVYYSCKDREGIIRNYQKFIERTRYLRRGDYVLSDAVISPLVIEEIGANENMQIRMLTSMIRHHTVATAPITAYLHKGAYLNEDEVHEHFQDFIAATAKVSSGRLIVNSSNVDHLKYNPVGYVFSNEKDKEDEKLKLRKKMIENRKEKYQKTLDSVEKEENVKPA